MPGGGYEVNDVEFVFFFNSFFILGFDYCCSVASEAPGRMRAKPSTLLVPRRRQAGLMG